MARDNSKKVSCSVILKELHDFYNPNQDPQRLKDFMRGFWAGEAEKVYLGACKAAMFRPDFEKHQWVRADIPTVASRYGLLHRFFPTSYGGESWIIRPQYERLVLTLAEFEEDSPAWHIWRARLCGIPDEEIDTEFHLRYGRKVYIG